MLRLHTIEIHHYTRKGVADESVLNDCLAEAFLGDAHNTKLASWRYITGPIDASTAEFDEFEGEIGRMVPILRSDYWETGDIIGEFIWMHSATLQPQFRGVGLGAVLTGMLVDQVTRGREFGLVACYAGPLDLPPGDPDHTENYRFAQPAIAAVWRQLGLVSSEFDPYLLRADLRLATPEAMLKELVRRYQERGDREGWIEIAQD